MKPFRLAAWASGLLVWLLSAVPAEAAWCNVFQVCCHRGRGVAVSGYAPSACCEPAPCCPQPVCTTRYVQRCYYQPVTCYQTKTYYEPVTTYRTSYYYEPVTSYRYSCYYDPCTCSYQQVACPTTCYQLRSQCCPVQSWVQRCCSVPVTSYQQSFYWEPVTTCCTPSCPTVAAAPCANGAEATAAPPVAAYPAPAQPGVSEQRAPAVPAPAIQETPGRGAAPQYYYPPANPPTSGSSFRQPAPAPRAAPAGTPPPPQVRLDGIVALPSGRVEGVVVHDNQAPAAGTKVMFVSAEQKATQRTVTSDAGGQFRLALESGTWLVYLHGSDGRPLFKSKIDVRDRETRPMTLVSR